jgi:hypothetical protein
LKDDGLGDPHSGGDLGHTRLFVPEAGKEWDGGVEDGLAARGGIQAPAPGALAKNVLRPIAGLSRALEWCTHSEEFAAGGAELLTPSLAQTKFSHD